MISSSNLFTSKFKLFNNSVIRADVGVFRDLKERLSLKIDFDGFLTMLIKFFNQAIEDPEQYKLMMIMNSDSTANLKFIKMLPFKQLEQLSLKFKLGEMDAIQKHVVF